MEKAKYNIGDKVVFLGNTAIIKEIKINYIIQVSDNKPEIVEENELRKYSDLLPLALIKYIRDVLKVYPYNPNTDYVYSTENHLEIVLRGIGNITLPVKSESLEKLEKYRSYLLEDLGL